MACAAGRKDLESVAILTRADTYSRASTSRPPGRSWPRRVTSRKRAGRSTPGAASTSWGKIYLLLGELEQAEAASAEAIVSSRRPARSGRSRAR